jgi:hypothetical protein
MKPLPLVSSVITHTRRLCGLCVLAMLSHGCAGRLPASSKPFDRALTLNSHSLTVHFANAEAEATRPLIVYTTGDGGWVRKDLAFYHTLVSWGYPVAGFSAPDYVKYLPRESETTTPGRLGRDYNAIIAFARASMNVPASRPVVLVGVSRGAGLSVVAAGLPRVRDELAGVVAVALTKEEEHVRWFGLPRLPTRNRAIGRLVTLEVYEYLPRLGTLPLAVVQSSHDSYLPAPAAQRLFGADTATRRFIAVRARNHSFSGARDEMYDAVDASLRWINGLLYRDDTRVPQR